jgi:hypothetical protein
MRTYRIGKGVRVSDWAFAAVWFAFAFGFAVYADPPRHWSLGLVAGWAVLLLFGLWPAIMIGLTPQEVVVGDDGTCDFRSLLRHRRIRAQRMTYINDDDGSVYIYYDGGKIRVNPMRDFERFVAHLLELNPAIKLSGWAKREVEARLAARERSPWDA